MERTRKDSADLAPSSAVTYCAEQENNFSVLCGATLCFNCGQKRQSNGCCIRIGIDKMPGSGWLQHGWFRLICRDLQESDMKKLMSILALTAVMLSGCATYPAAVRVDNEATLVSYPAAVKAGLTQGPARWSGVIARVQNNSQDTRLEIVYFPSNASGRPLVDKNTEGRFVAYVAGFLDPVVYQTGKQVTVLGQLSPFEQGKVDNFQYNYPVLQQAKVYLWPKQKDVERVEFLDSPWWRHPYPYPYYPGPAIRIRTTTPTQGSDHVQSEQGSQ
jgi:outer membrane lipoprotein